MDHQPPAAPRRDLTALFDPRSVAIVGASDDTSKWGNALAQRALAAPGQRPVHLVNRRGGSVLGRPALRSLADLGPTGDVDLVALCVPVGSFLAAVDDALAAGARALVAITAGLAELGPEGARVQGEAVARVRAAGAVMVGPNCLGIHDTTTGLHLSSEALAPGHVAVLSQSGNMVIDLDDLMRRAGLGISRFVSLGNQADLTVVDLMRACVVHEPTTAVAIYAEDVVDGRGFVAAARELDEAGKPVVLLAPGRTDAATRSAASHTGSLTSASRVVDAVCAAGGIHRVESPAHLVDVLAALDAPRRGTGRRVAVVTDGGGHGAIAADALGAAGLETPLLSPALGAQLTGVLWSQSTVTNPVDLAGVGEQDMTSYEQAIGLLLDSGEVDAVLLTGTFGVYNGTRTSLAAPEMEAAHAIAARVVGQHKPFVVHTVYAGSPPAQVLRDAGIPVHRDAGPAAAALSAACTQPRAGRFDDLATPPAAERLAGTGYSHVRGMLVAAGVPFPPAVLVHDEAGLLSALATARPTYPVVLKAMGLLHKSDAGGVVLGLRDEATAVAAYRDLVARLAPPAVSVEQMVDTTDGVEIIVGSRTDHRFGPVLMVGLGGVFTEIVDDVTFALGPVTPRTATELLLSLRGAALLTGARGRKPVDLDTLATLVARVSSVAAEHPELAELEVNPVLATADGVVGLDARAITR